MNEIIQIGSRGALVKAWQTFLVGQGFAVHADGHFGPDTLNSTKNFQLSKGIKPDGIVGPITSQFMLVAKENTCLTENICLWPNQEYNSMVQYYGPVGENQTTLEMPYALKLAWDPQTKIKKITCHIKVAQSVYRIFEQALSVYGAEDIVRLNLDLFGGCLNVRKKRGGQTWSTHAWGAAIDLDPDNNQLKWGRSKAHFARPEYQPFWQIIEKEGWTSLGRKKDYDWMHFQAATC